MNRTHTHSRALLFTAFAGVAVIGVGACSDDGKKLTVEDVNTSNATLPPGVTLAPGVPGATDCQAVLVKYITTMSAAYTPGAQTDFAQAFAELAALMPADLTDELTILSLAYQAYGAVLAANNNDVDDPDVQAAVATLNTPEVNAASDTIGTYFDTTCPT